MFKTLRAVGKRGKDKLASSSSSSKKSGSKAADKQIIGGPVLVNDSSDSQLTKNAPTRPMTKVDIHQLVRTSNLVEMKKHRFTDEEVNLRNNDGHTPLHAACSLDRGNIEVVAYLISLGADVNATDKAGWTPLHAACRFDETGHLIPLLVSHGADVNIANTDGTRPLHYFARKRLQPETLESNARALDVMLTAGADLNVRNVNDETPLHSCVMKGNLATLELLINRSADINAVNKVGDNVLHNAVLCQKLDMISKLLRMGMDPTLSAPNSLNGSPLDLTKKDTSAAGKKIYELLTRPAIEDEADEVAETDKKTDLWSLTKAGDWNEIKKLYGSEEKQKVVLRVTEEELKARNSAGRCLLHLACNQAEPNREMIEYLIANNPTDINCVDNNGCTPLHYACKKNNDAETVVILVVKGADVSRSSNDGMKPIHYFARRALLPESVVSNEKGLDYLMKFGADINAPNKYGETPLHNAILQGNLLMVQLLLSKDPDLTLTNRYNENVLHYAIISQKKDMVDKILDLGIDPRVGSATNGTPLESAKLLSSGQGKEVYEIIQRKATSLDIAGMTDEEKREYKRKRVIDELVETEREYANDLGIIIKVYVNPLKTVMNTDEGLMEWQIEDIFGNIEEIKEASDKMSRALQLCQLADPQYFGQVFLNRMEDLQKYEEVCVHQQIATDALQEALHSNKAFRSFCEAAQKHKDCKKLSIDALLIKPFQRITKYPLLLRELMGVTPEDHPDYPDIAKARDKLEVLINVANEKKRVIDSKMLIKQISDNLVYRDDEERLDLTLDEERVFKREGLFKMSFNKEKMFKRTVLLFSDLILLCHAEKKKYGYHHYIPISQCRVQDVTDGALEGGKAVKNALSLTYQAKQLRVVICTDSAETKKEWMSAIAECAAAEPLTPKLRHSDGGSTVGGASVIRSSQTLPAAFKGFGLRKHAALDDHSNSGDEGSTSPRHNNEAGGSMNRSAPPLSQSDKKKRLGSTTISPPPSSSLSLSTPHGTTSSGPPSPSGSSSSLPATAPLERRTSKLGDDSSSSGGGILGVLRRKASTGERFKGGPTSDIAVSSPIEASPTRTGHANTVSGALRGGTTSHYEPAGDRSRPRTPSAALPSVGFTTGSAVTHSSSSGSFPAIPSTPSSPACARFSASADSSPASSPPTGLSASLSSSSPSGTPKRRVRALSSYNTAPNRPLPSLPSGGGAQTFAAASAAAQAASSTTPSASSSPSPPAAQKASEPAASGPPMLAASPSARSLSVSSLGTNFNVPLPLSTQHPIAKALFDFVGDKEAFQIDLKEGDVVTVFEKDEEKGDGWWYGECNKTTGYFPSHFVELL